VAGVAASRAGIELASVASTVARGERVVVEADELGAAESSTPTTAIRAFVDPSGTRPCAFE
jgi:hypothetical protein